MKVKTWFIGHKEQLLFAMLCLIFLGPVFGMTWLLTLDGPSHLYSATIIRELVSGNSGSMISTYVDFTPVPVPNWLGHFILSVSGVFCSVSTSMKLLHALYVIGIIYSFRWFALVLYPERSWPAYLIFPFVYNYFFFLGFYNFLFSLILMFFIAAEWMRSDGQGKWKRDTLLFTALFIALWFSHFAGFVMTLLIIGLYHVVKVIVHRGNVPGRTLPAAIKTLAIPVILPCVFTRMYYAYKHTGDAAYLPKPMVTQILWDFNMLTSYAVEWTSYIDVFRVLIVLPLVAAVWIVAKQRKQMSPAQLQSFLLCGILASVTLALCYAAPDGDGSGSYVTARLVLLFYLFAVLVLGALQLDQRVVIAGITLLVFMSWKLNRERDSGLRINSGIAQNVMHVSEQIEQESTLTGFVFSHDQYRIHVVDLAAAERKCIMLNNYETATDYFPLAMTAFSANGEPRKPEPSDADYMLLVGDYRSAGDTTAAAFIQKKANARYNLIAEEGEARLYKRR